MLPEFKNYGENRGLRGVLFDTLNLFVHLNKSNPPNMAPPVLLLGWNFKTLKGVLLWGGVNFFYRNLIDPKAAIFFSFLHP